MATHDETRAMSRYVMSERVHKARVTGLRSGYRLRCASDATLKALVILTICGLLTAACGSSGKSSSSTAKRTMSALRGATLAFATCMRSHGVPNFPDPRSTGPGMKPGMGFSLGSGVNPQSPAFRSAQASCRHLLSAGGPGSAHPSPQVNAQLLKVSQCMRQHGISHFPDPTTNPPSSTTGYSDTYSRDGVYLAVPNSIDVQSPAFKHAAATCGFTP